MQNFSRSEKFDISVSVICAIGEIKIGETFRTVQTMSHCIITPVSTRLHTSTPLNHRSTQPKVVPDTWRCPLFTHGGAHMRALSMVLY